MKTLQTAKKDPVRIIFTHCNEIQWKSKQTSTPYIGVLIGSDLIGRPVVTSDIIAAHSLHIFELVDLFLSPRNCDVRSKKIDILQQ